MSETTRNMTDDRAARRYHHIATLERQLSITHANIATAKAHVSELREQERGLIQRIRAAARDEGELPLFDLDGE